MNFKNWLLFSLGAAAVFVAFLGVTQLGQFNLNFRSKEFFNSPSASASIVPLSAERFAVVQGDNVTVYAVDAQGRLSIKDSIGGIYAGTLMKQRQNFSIKAPEKEVTPSP